MRNFRLVAVIASMFALNAYAADNNIYIQQSGDNSTVTMTQDGAGNIVQGLGGSASNSIINGNNNTVTVDQVGTGNTLNFGVQTSMAKGLVGNNYSYTVTGNNATAIIDSNNNGNNTSASNNINVTQTGNYANLNVNVLGSGNNIAAATAGRDYNSFVSTVNGSNNNQTVNVSGGGNNNVIINQGMGGSALGLNSAGQPLLPATTDVAGTVNLSVIGASNSVDVTQTGGMGVTGHMANISLDGSSNVANIIQQGVSANSIIRLTSVGNGNTFTLSSNTH